MRLRARITLSSKIVYLRISAKRPCVSLTYVRSFVRLFIRLFVRSFFLYSVELRMRPHFSEKADLAASDNPIAIFSVSWSHIDSRNRCIRSNDVVRGQSLRDSRDAKYSEKYSNWTKRETYINQFNKDCSNQTLGRRSSLHTHKGMYFHKVAQ